MGILNLKIDVDMVRAPVAAKMEKQADDVVGVGALEIGNIFARAIAENTPLGATKLLRGSYFAEARGVPIREVLVGTPHLYGPIVDRGRQPGKMPPDAPIRLWVMRKLGIGGAAEVNVFSRTIAALSGRHRRKKADREAGQQLAADKLDHVTMLVRRKIAARGTPGAAQSFKGFQQGRPAAERVANKIGGTIVAEWEK